MPDPGRPSLRDTPGPDSPADPAAILAGMREDWDNIGGKPVRHVPRLLAAVEAVLALVDPPTTVVVADLDGNWETVRRVVDCGKVREAITRALLGDTP